MEVLAVAGTPSIMLSTVSHLLREKCARRRIWGAMAAPSIRRGGEECLITRAPYHEATAWTRRTDRRIANAEEVAVLDVVALTEHSSRSPITCTSSAAPGRVTAADIQGGRAGYSWRRPSNHASQHQRLSRSAEQTPAVQRHVVALCD